MKRKQKNRQAKKLEYERRMQSAGKEVVSQGKPLDLKVLKGLELEGDDVLMQPSQYSKAATTLLPKLAPSLQPLCR